MKKIDRSNEVALITGGATGIGLAISERLHEMGLNVVIAARRKAIVDELVTKLNSIRPNSAYGMTMDVRCNRSINENIKTLPDAFKTVDILINNAGLGVSDLLVDCSESDWDLVIDTSLKGPFLLSKAILPNMIERRKGYIINISSQAGKHGYSNAGPYCAAKFGLMGFAKALQEEVKEHNIQVHNLMPALTQVPAPKDEKGMTKDWLQTSDLADMVEFIITRPARVQLEDIGLMGR